MDSKQITNTLCKLPGLGGLGIACPIINKVTKTESCQENGDCGMGMGGAMLAIFNSIICLVAFYFVFKCGGHFLDFLAACCCSGCYIAYRLAVPCVKQM